MKLIYTIITLIAVSTSFGQFKNLFYIDTTSGMVLPQSRLGNLASKYFWDGKYDSSLFYLDSLEKVQPYKDYYDEPLQINKMLVYARLGNTNEFKPRVQSWIASQDTNAICTCLEESPIFSLYYNQGWYKKLISNCWKLKRNVSYSNVELTDRLGYLGMIDQNSLICKTSYGERCGEITDSLLEINVKTLASLIDTLNLPSKSEIGHIGRAAIFMVILHADFNPELQLRIAERMLAQLESYPPDWVAFITDRALSYNGKPQRYGFYRSKLHEDEIERINKNRIAIGLEPISPE
ncbi:MAG: hypothetical protein HUJ25_05730 [Crocinitomicaceae bacterium]|nr:hypothetical protein [Crocinitomicaceae bacterium]